MGIFSQIFYPGANTDFAKARLDRSIFTILVVYAILNSLIVAILTLVSATSHGISYHGMVSYGIVHTVFFSVVYAAYLFFRARIHWVEQHHSTSLDSHPLPSAQAGLLGKVKAFAKRLTGPGREKSQTRAVEGFRVNGGSHDHDTSYRPQPSPSHPYPGAAHHGASTHASHSSTSSGSTSGLSKPDNDPFSSDHALDHDDRYAPDHHSASSFHSSPYVLPPLPYQTTSPNHHHHHHHHNARQHSLDHLMDPEEIDLASLHPTVSSLSSASSVVLADNDARRYARAHANADAARHASVRGVLGDARREEHGGGSEAASLHLARSREQLFEADRTRTGVVR